MDTVVRKISSTAFGLFMGRSDEQPQRSPLWVRLFAHAAHQIGDAGYEVSVFTSDRETRLDMSLPSGHQLRIILDREAESSPFIYVRFMPYDSLYYEDVVQPVFMESNVLRDFTLYRSQYYSHPLSGSNDEMVSFLTTISIEIFSKCISHEADNNQVS